MQQEAKEHHETGRAVGNSVRFRNVRFTFYSPYSFKFEFSPGGDFIDRELFVTEIAEAEDLRINVTKKDNSITVATGALTVRYDCCTEPPTGRTFSVLYRHGEAEKEWSYGRKDTGNLKGTTMELKNWPFPEVSRNLTDGALSTDGFYVYEDTSRMYWTEDKSWAEKLDTGGAVTLFFSGYGKDYRRGLREFSRIFGKVPMLPRWAFGYWYSRWFRYYQDELTAIVDKFRNFNIPLDVVVVDTDWRKWHPYRPGFYMGAWFGYDWNKMYFPDAQRFIKEMKERNVHVTLNDHPAFRGVMQPVDESDSHFEDLMQRLGEAPELRTFTVDGGEKKLKAWRCDWARKDHADAYCDVLLRSKLEEGIDFWWIDGHVTFQKPEDEFRSRERQTAVTAFDIDINDYDEIHPQLWTNYQYYRTTQKHSGQKRAMILSRWGGIGSHRYPLWFSGDTQSNWETLKHQIYFTYTAGNVLTNYWSHDICGFKGEISRELFLRWLQFGIFSPIVRTHSSSQDIHEPWMFDRKTIELFAKYIRLRYRLIPYWYGLSYESYEDALPLVRGMYHEFPDDPYAYEYKNQYMAGASLLVAPVANEDNTKEVYFPDGKWISLLNGEELSGPARKEYMVAPEEIPLFVKKGAVFPAAHAALSAADIDCSRLCFEIFPAAHRTAYRYYEDDGVSLGYRNGEFIQIPVSCESEDGVITVRLGEMTGTYRGAPEERTVTVIMHLPAGTAVRKAVLNDGAFLDIIAETQVFGELESRFSSSSCSFPYSGNELKVQFITD